MTKQYDELLEKISILENKISSLQIDFSDLSNWISQQDQPHMNYDSYCNCFKCKMRRALE